MILLAESCRLIADVVASNITVHTQLERKRHIGNDVVVIIFKDTQPGKPSSPLPIQFASHMTRTPFFSP
jgi:hypothetical protein